MKHIYIRTSPIDGKGVYAGEDIDGGDIIRPVKGKMVFFTVKNKEDSLSYPNWIGVGQNQWIDPEKPMKFINHSCDPNVGAITRKNNGLAIVAMKPIKEGEELTLDYSIIEGDPLWEMKCRCGSKKCRGTVRSITSIPKRQFKKYLPYVPTYFQELYEKKDHSQ